MNHDPVSIRRATRTSSTSVRRLRRSAIVALAVAAGLAGCAGSDGPELSELGARGREVSINNSCASCHGNNGQGVAGPTWIGLAGSDVELADGTVIVADDEYLTRAITDPSADLLADYTLQMPRNNLNDDEVAAVVAYIKELSVPQD